VPLSHVFVVDYLLDIQSDRAANPPLSNQSGGCLSTTAGNHSGPSVTTSDIATPPSAAIPHPTGDASSSSVLAGTGMPLRRLKSQASFTTAGAEYQRQLAAERPESNPTVETISVDELANSTKAPDAAAPISRSSETRAFANTEVSHPEPGLTPTLPLSTLVLPVPVSTLPSSTTTSPSPAPSDSKRQREEANNQKYEEQKRRRLEKQQARGEAPADPSSHRQKAKRIREQKRAQKEAKRNAAQVIGSVDGVSDDGEATGGNGGQKPAETSLLHARPGQSEAPSSSHTLGLQYLEPTSSILREVGQLENEFLTELNSRENEPLVVDREVKGQVNRSDSTILSEDAKVGDVTEDENIMAATPSFHHVTPVGCISWLLAVLSDAKTISEYAIYLTCISGGNETAICRCDGGGDRSETTSAAIL
jgi:hypothetical protein